MHGEVENPHMFQLVADPVLILGRGHGACIDKKALHRLIGMARSFVVMVVAFINAVCPLQDGRDGITEVFIVASATRSGSDGLFFLSLGYW